MKLLCLAGRHRIAPVIVVNAGIGFGSCQSCRREMVRARARWRPVPKGFRIVWKPVERTAPVMPREIPLLMAPEVEAVEPPAKRKPRRVRRGVTFSELVPAGLRLLAWSGAAGLRHWRANLATRRVEQKPMLFLSAR